MSAQRLPTPGGDSGNWGDILNGFLRVSLASDGTLNPNVVTNTQLDQPTQAAIADIANKAPIASPTFTGKIVTPSLQVTGGSPSSGQILTSDNSGNAAWATAPIASNATTGEPGLVQLSGDFGGSATSPVVKNHPRTATVVVAASNSSAEGKAAADFVCTGNGTTGGDEVVIQNALRQLKNTPQGKGKIVLLEGTFYRTNPIYVDQQGVTLEGQGDSTIIVTAANGQGYASIINGSNGSFDGVMYLSGDTAPTGAPNECIFHDFLIQDYQSAGVALPGSNHGLVVRGGDVRINNVNVKIVNLDGIRYESFRQMGVAGTLGVAVSTTPQQGTQETWTVSGIASPPATPFYALVTPASGYDSDPEGIYVASTGTYSGGSATWTVLRGVSYSTTKAHAVGANITLMSLTTMFNTITQNCNIYCALRTGILTENEVSDCEWFACIINGGTSASVKYTVNGIFNGAGNVRFIACHPYFCQQYGFYGWSQPYNSPYSIIVVQYHAGYRS